MWRKVTLCMAREERRGVTVNDDASRSLQIFIQLQPKNGINPFSKGVMELRNNRECVRVNIPYRLRREGFVWWRQENRERNVANGFWNRRHGHVGGEVLHRWKPLRCERKRRLEPPWLLRSRSPPIPQWMNILPLPILTHATTLTYVSPFLFLNKSLRLKWTHSLN